MYSVSSTYLTKIKESTRTVASKIVIGDRTLTDSEVQSFSVDWSFGNDGIPGIGGIVSAKLNMRLIRQGNTPSYYTTQTIKPYVAIEDNAGNQMWVPLGVFYPQANSIKRDDYTVEVECFDILTTLDTIEYKSSLTFPTSIGNIVNEIKTKYSLPIKSPTGLPNVNYKVKPTGQSVRATLAEIAELATTNAIMDRNGELVFKKIVKTSFALDTNNYSTFTLESDSSCKITKLICEKGGQDADGKEIADLECGNTTGATLRFQNDSITTAAELKTVYDRMFPYTYNAYELKGQGMPHLEVGDIITLTDKKDVVYELPLMTATLEYNGGMLSTFGAKAPATSGSTGSTGSNSITNTVSQLQANSITVNTILAGNITADNIKANSITADRIDAKTMTAESGVFDNLKVTTAMIADAKIDMAQIENLKVGQAQIGDLAVGTAQIADAAIVNAKIGKLAVDTANINDAAITNAKIKDLNADKITAGDISADRIKTNVITAVNASIGSATIDSAKIGNLSADKITSGDIATDRLKANAINAVNATIGDATINAAKIGNLSADKITTGDISADRMKTNAISAINASIGNAVISSAKIGNLDASKITTGTLSADRIKAGSIDATKIATETISAIEVNAGNIVANKIATGDIKVGNANIVDGTISGAKISNATITNAQISSAFVADAYIKNLDAGKITTGTLDATKVAINSASGRLAIADNTITIKDAQATPKTRVQIGLDARGNYGIYVLNAAGKAIFDSDKGVLLPEGLNSNVVTTDKIKDEAVGSNKLNTDELFVGDNAFINKLKAVEINAANITTGKISSERIDINGLISFEAFDKTLQPIFNVQGDKTYINGGMIATNTIQANSIDLLSGLTVKGADGKPVFAVGKVSDGVGTVEVNGWLHSSNYVPGKSGYSITTDGNSEFNQATIRGTLDVLDAGVTNTGTADTDIRIWAGGTYEGRGSAKFRVNKKGDLFATNATLSGTLYGSLENEMLHINNSSLTINNEVSALNDDGTVMKMAPRAIQEVVKLNSGQCAFNTDVVFGNNNVTYSKGDNLLNLKDTNFTVNSKQGTVKIESGDGAFGGLNIIGPSQGHHVLRGSTSTDKLGTLVFDAEGNQGEKGDFSFTRKNYNEKCKVHIDGDLTVNEKINSQVQKIEMRSVKNSTWDGWGFYAN